MELLNNRTRIAPRAGENGQFTALNAQIGFTALTGKSLKINRRFKPVRRANPASEALALSGITKTIF